MESKRNMFTFPLTCTVDAGLGIEQAFASDQESLANISIYEGHAFPYALFCS